MSRTNPSKGNRNEAARAKAEQMRREAEARSRRNRNIIVGVTVAVVAALFIAVIVAWQSASREAALNSKGPDGLSNDSGIVVGQESAPVTVTVLSDFMCPACRQFEDANKAQLAELRDNGEIKVEYIPVSILDRFSQGTKFSTRAAGAAYCVAEHSPDTYVDFNDEMFSQQPAEGTSGLSSDEIAAIAARAGASDAAQQCIKDNTYADFATKVTSDSGVQGTPTVKVNGTQVQNWSPENIKAEIDKAAGEG